MQHRFKKDLKSKKRFEIDLKSNFVTWGLHCFKSSQSFPRVTAIQNLLYRCSRSDYYDYYDVSSDLFQEAVEEGQQVAGPPSSAASCHGGI